MTDWCSKSTRKKGQKETQRKTKEAMEGKFYKRNPLTVWLQYIIIHPHCQAISVHYAIYLLLWKQLCHWVKIKWHVSSTPTIAAACFSRKEYPAGDPKDMSNATSVGLPAWRGFPSLCVKRHTKRLMKVLMVEPNCRRWRKEVHTCMWQSKYDSDYTEVCFRLSIDPIVMVTKVKHSNIAQLHFYYWKGIYSSETTIKYKHHTFLWSN